MNKKPVRRFVPIAVYALFIIISLITGYGPGKEISMNLAVFSIGMIKVLPCAFILIGLFEVWVKNETIQKHLGAASGLKGYVWAVLLSGTTVGGLYVAFPVAYSLYNKGARLSVIFSYLGASALCRVPMTIFEASFLGLKFSIIRLLVSLPLVIVTSMLLGSYLTKNKYKIMKVE
ncbi:MAG: permease [Deltaproteobacteria bacterium]|nr:permease [Deltaproteobacteria bacterium]